MTPYIVSFSQKDKLFSLYHNTYKYRTDRVSKVPALLKWREKHGQTCSAISYAVNSWVSRFSESPMAKRPVEPRTLENGRSQLC